jgi:hypothetical protein
VSVLVVHTRTTTTSTLWLLLSPSIPTVDKGCLVILEEFLRHKKTEVFFVTFALLALLRNKVQLQLTKRQIYRKKVMSPLCVFQSDFWVIWEQKKFIYISLSWCHTTRNHYTNSLHTPSHQNPYHTPTYNNLDKVETLYRHTLHCVCVCMCMCMCVLWECLRGKSKMRSTAGLPDLIPPDLTTFLP